MNALELIGLGATFAGLVIACFAAGVVVGQASGQPAWALAGLLTGMALGGFVAYRRLAKFMR